jgi:hypothetical protein
MGTTNKDDPRSSLPFKPLPKPEERNFLERAGQQLMTSFKRIGDFLRSSKEESPSKLTEKKGEADPGADNIKDMTSCSRFKKNPRVDL